MERPTRRPRLNAPRRAGLAVVLGIAAAACPSRTEPPAADPRRPPVERNLEPLLRALRRAQDEVAAFQTSARAQVRNAESHRDGLNKARRVFEGLRFARLVPSEPDTKALEGWLRTAARQARLRVVAFSATPSGDRPPSPPDTVTMPETPRYTPAQLRRAIEVRLVLRPADLARLEQLWRTLRAPEAPRLLVVRRIRLDRHAAHLEAEAYQAQPLTPPRYVVRPPTLERLLSSASREALKGFQQDERVGKELATLRRMLEEARKDAEAATRALEPLPEADLLVARTEWLTRTTRTLREQRFEALLDDPPP